MSLSRKLSMLSTALRLGKSHKDRLKLIWLFARHGGWSSFTGELQEIEMRGKNVPRLYLRNTASDAVLFVEVLVEEDYSALRALPFKPEHILDVGANIGLASFYMRTLFPEASLVGCEPSFAEGAVLNYNYACWLRCQHLPVAIGDRDHAEVTFAVHPEKTGGQHVMQGNEVGEWLQVTVPMRRVDALIDDGSMTAPDLVKMDIEGAEVEALRGFGRHLSSPRAYILETHSPSLHHDCKQLLNGGGFTVLSDRPRSGEARILCMLRND